MSIDIAQVINRGFIGGLSDAAFPQTPEDIGREIKNPGCFGKPSQRDLDRSHVRVFGGLLRQIDNIPDGAGQYVRIKSETSNGGRTTSLVAEFPQGGDHPLINVPKDNGFSRSIDPLKVLGIRQKLSVGSKFVRALQWVGNRITRDRDYAHSQYRAIDRDVLKQLVKDRLSALAKSPENIIVDPKFMKTLGDDVFLKGISLMNKPLHECDLRGSDLSNRNLCGSSLPVDLTGADLTGARLFSVTFVGPDKPWSGHCVSADELMEEKDDSWFRRYPDFSGVELQGAKLTMPSPFEDIGGDRANILDRGYNHLNSAKSGSLLTSIHSIDNVNLKRALMEENVAILMANTSPQERVGLSAPLSDILFNSDYLDPASVVPMGAVRKLVNELVEYHFATGNEQRLDLDTLGNIDKRVFLKEHLSHATGFVDTLVKQERPTFEDAPAAFCQQLIQACAQVDEGDLRESASALQRSVCRLPANTAAVRALSDALGHEEPDAIALGDIAVFTHGEDTVAMSGKYYQTFIQSSVQGKGTVKHPEDEIALTHNSSPGQKAEIYRSSKRIPFLQRFLSPSLDKQRTNWSRLGLDQIPEFRKILDTHSLARNLADTVPDEIATIIATLLKQPDPSTRGENSPMFSVRTPLAATDTYINSLLDEAGLGSAAPEAKAYFLLSMAKVASDCGSNVRTAQTNAMLDLATGLTIAASEHLPLDGTTASKLVDERRRNLTDTYHNPLATELGWYTRFGFANLLERTLGHMATRNPDLKAIYTPSVRQERRL
jgi:hypothetical protein